MSIFVNTFKNTFYYGIERKEFLTLSEKIKSAISTIDTNTINADTVLQKISDYEVNINKNTINGNNFIASIDEIFLNSISIGDTKTDSYGFHKSLFNFIVNTPFQKTTKDRDNLLINLALFQQSIAVYSLSNALDNIATIPLKSGKQIETLISEINKQFNFVLTNNIYIDFFKNEIILIDILPKLIDMFSSTIDYLNSSELSLPREQEIEVGNNSLIPLTYQYYGSIDNRNILYLLNNRTAAFNITGKFKVLAKK